MEISKTRINEMSKEELIILFNNNVNETLTNAIKSLSRERSKGYSRVSMSAVLEFINDISDCNLIKIS